MGGLVGVIAPALVSEPPLGLHDEGGVEVLLL